MNSRADDWTDTAIIVEEFTLILVHIFSFFVHEINFVSEYYLQWNTLKWTFLIRILENSVFLPDLSLKIKKGCAQKDLQDHSIKL